MKNVYYQFNFERFKPKKLERLAKTISFNSLNMQPDSNKLQRLMEKLRCEARELRSSEIKFLCFFVKLLKKEGLLKQFVHACQNCFNKESRILYHIKGLLASLYNDFNDNELYKLLRYAIIRNSVWKESLIPVKDLVLNSQDVASFHIILNIQFKGCNTIEEIHQVKRCLLIDDNHLIFQNILLRMLKNRILEIYSNKDFDFVNQIIDFFKDINLVKPAIEEFLLTQGSRKDFDNLPIYLEKMFELIGEKLGDAYGSTRNKWQGIREEAKRIFTLWKTQKQINYFFGEIMGDPTRLNFWKMYSHYFYRIDYIEKYDGAILMETHKHLFIEFTDMGAMHMHDLKKLNIDQIRENAKSYGKTKMISMFLKNKSMAVTHLSHWGGWQWSFEWELKKYGYEIKKVKS